MDVFKEVEGLEATYNLTWQLENVETRIKLCSDALATPLSYSGDIQPLSNPKFVLQDGVKDHSPKSCSNVALTPCCISELLDRCRASPTKKPSHSLL